MLLGCITRKWNHLIEYFISASYDPVTISKLYHEVCSLFTGRYQSSHSKEESTDTKVCVYAYGLNMCVNTCIHDPLI